LKWLVANFKHRRACSTECAMQPARNGSSYFEGHIAHFFLHGGIGKLFRRSLSRLSVRARHSGGKGYSLVRVTQTRVYRFRRARQRDSRLGLFANSNEAGQQTRVVQTSLLTFTVAHVIVVRAVDKPVGTHIE
jgi:hypothetical protein